MSENTALDLDSLLDSSLDDLEDLPEFKPFVPGAHRALVSLDLKEVNGKKAVELSMKHMETLELAEPSRDTAPNPGDIASILFMLDNEFARAKMKKITAPLAAALGTSTIRELIEAAKDVESVVITSYRKNKEDPSSPYMDVKELQVV